jgi:hypothetical protein
MDGLYYNQMLDYDGNSPKETTNQNTENSCKKIMRKMENMFTFVLQTWKFCRQLLWEALFE